MRMNCFLLLIPISWNHFFIIVAIWASLTSYSFSWTTKFIAWWKRSACSLTSLGLRTVCFFLFFFCLNVVCEIIWTFLNCLTWDFIVAVFMWVTSYLIYCDLKCESAEIKRSKVKRNGFNASYFFSVLIFSTCFRLMQVVYLSSRFNFITRIYICFFFRALCSRLLLSFCTHYIRASSCFSVECCYWRVFMSCCLFQGCKSWLVWPSIARYMSFFCLWFGDCIDSVEFAFHWICQIWRFCICTEFYRMSGWSDTPLIYSIYSPATFQLVICLFAFINRLAHKVRIYVLLLCWCLRVTLYTLFLSLTLPNFGRICVVSAQLSLFPIAFCVYATFYSPANKLVFSNFVLQQPV